MTNVPTLLDETGAASIATAVMMSHHGFRRDIPRFGAAMEALAGGGAGNLDALRDEWRSFRATLHGHHYAEDTGIFPNLAREHEALRPTLERLTEDHRRIDPLLERGDGAFADLPRTVATAAEVIAELGALLEPHLATEEAEVIPHLRALKAFPPPASAEEAEMLTQGFAWACHGIAPEVLERVYTMLSPDVSARLAAARAAFEQRWRRVWGAGVEVTASFTPIPAQRR
jgi:hemerythrin-like domain-containing protein